MKFKPHELPSFRQAVYASVPCPRCFAKLGEACRKLPSGSPADWPHKARTTWYHRLVLHNGRIS